MINEDDIVFVKIIVFVIVFSTGYLNSPGGSRDAAAAHRNGRRAVLSHFLAPDRLRQSASQFFYYE